LEFNIIYGSYLNMLYVWSLFVRVSHWLLVTAFTVAFLTYQSLWDLQTHVLAGYSAGALLLGRITWGILAQGYCNFSRFPFKPKEGLLYARAAVTGQAKRYMGHNPAGSLIIYGLLVIGLFTVASGLLRYNDAYLPISSKYPQMFHSITAWTWLGLVATHIIGVLVESMLHRENLILTMITGCKRRRIHHKTGQNTAATSPEHA
jgi:cytochrome b